tara:strand:+ start:298 stop:474 length:177 start_codon:yes stop_codon:yes gene_type:complete
MSKILVIALLTISILSGCSINDYFSFPNKFDICDIDVREVKNSNNFPDGMFYISVGWC